jgi:hypothetical protein
VPAPPSLDKGRSLSRGGNECAHPWGGAGAARRKHRAGHRFATEAKRAAPWCHFTGRTSRCLHCGYCNTRPPRPLRQTPHGRPFRDKGQRRSRGGGECARPWGGTGAARCNTPGRSIYAEHQANWRQDQRSRAGVPRGLSGNNCPCSRMRYTGSDSATRIT